MSVFDPYKLYTHQQRKSHKGQVIQKKPTGMPYAYTLRDLKQATFILKNFGYYISNKPIPPTSLYTSKVYNDLILSDIVITPGTSNSINISLSTFWNNIKNDFSQILSIDTSRVTSFNFQISLISFFLGPSLSKSSSSSTGISINVSNLPIFTSTQNILSYQVIETNPYNFGLILESINQTSYLKVAVIGDETSNESVLISNKPVQTSYPYLNQFSSTSLATFNELKSGELISYNPLLYTLLISSTNSSLNIPMLKTSALVSIGISYNE